MRCKLAQEKITSKRNKEGHEPLLQARGSTGAPPQVGATEADEVTEPELEAGDDLRGDET